MKVVKRVVEFPPGFLGVVFRRGSGATERERSGVRRASGGVPLPLAPCLRLQASVRVPFLKASGFSFLLFAGGVLPRVRRAGLADRCRRFRLCRTCSSYTSSYPDRCAAARAAGHRPLCRACLTAATGGSAPSNPRVNTRLTSCSYELEPPDRKGSRALISGSGSRQSLVEGSGLRVEEVTRRSTRALPSWPGRCASATDQWPAAAPGR